jgi:ABC-type multidrug transport system fused ATPase/permease subunit
MLRRQFEKVTVLAIAHRLETILDFDKVLVLDQGHVAEFDSPSVLLANPSGKFRAMFDSSTSSPVTATTGH